MRTRLRKLNICHVVKQAESSKWHCVWEALWLEKRCWLPVELMQSSLRDRCPKKRTKNGSKPTRKIINRWCGCVAMLITWKNHLSQKQDEAIRAQEFSRACIDGSTNHKSSNNMDHVTSELQRSAMMYCCKDQAKSRNEPITSYSPMARGLLSSSMDSAVTKQVKKEFDISFVLAK